MYSLGVVIDFIWTRDFHYDDETLSMALVRGKSIKVAGIPDEINELLNLLLKEKPEQRATSKQIFEKTKSWDLMNLSHDVCQSCGLF